MAFLQLQIDSKELGMPLPVWLYLPDNASREHPCKVVWLYHGGNGDHTAWALNANLEEESVQRNLAIVLPGVHRSCFVDTAVGQRFGSYVGRELPHKLRALFPALSRNREENAVAGFSNGGYGCLHVGLSNPELYGVIGAFSAGNKADVDFTGREEEKRLLFGEGEMQGGPYDLRWLAGQALASGAPLPRIYQAIGSLDPWYAQTQLMREYFSSLPGDPFRYQHHEMAQLGHVWIFWRAELVRFLDQIGW